MAEANWMAERCDENGITGTVKLTVRDGRMTVSTAR